MTALLPAVRFAVMRTRPPARTLTGKCIQAPLRKFVVMLTVRLVVPSVTVTFIRRLVVSQSKP